MYSEQISYMISLIRGALQSWKRFIILILNLIASFFCHFQSCLISFIHWPIIFFITFKKEGLYRPWKIKIFAEMGMLKTSFMFNFTAGTKNSWYTIRKNCFLFIFFSAEKIELLLWKLHSYCIHSPSSVSAYIFFFIRKKEIKSFSKILSAFLPPPLRPNNVL